jgi:hypothetical protein
MIEADAATIVRRIIAAPSRHAFDTTAGAIIRLFARAEELERRLVRLERLAGASLEIELQREDRAAHRPKRRGRRPRPINGADLHV